MPPQAAKFFFFANICWTKTLLRGFSSFFWKVKRHCLKKNCVVNAAAGGKKFSSLQTFVGPKRCLGDSPGGGGGHKENARGGGSWKQCLGGGLYSQTPYLSTYYVTFLATVPTGYLLLPSNFIFFFCSKTFYFCVTVIQVRYVLLPPLEGSKVSRNDYKQHALTRHFFSSVHEWNIFSFLARLRFPQNLTWESQ